MDSVMNKVKNAASGSHSTNSTQAVPCQQKPDMVDKVAAKFDSQHGGHVGANNREKITDSARNALESATGKKVPSKISN